MTFWSLMVLNFVKIVFTPFGKPEFSRMFPITHTATIVMSQFSMKLSLPCCKDDNLFFTQIKIDVFESLNFTSKTPKSGCHSEILDATGEKMSVLCVSVC